ncbi:MAG: hypothetical protein ACSHWW_03975 [Nonlabens sp.]|uniref:hypothetical protein n=1 Tax=Nonlabens sp. TaxID=1888209 RepID=UPI003EFA48A3
MNIELIKTELIQEVDQLFQKEHNKSLQKRIEKKIKSWKEQITETEELIERVNCTLQHILQRHGITFKHQLEKEGFTHYIEPTIHQLVLRNMKD